MSELKKDILNWEKTSNYYVDWFANTSLKGFFLKNINFEKFNIWWITNLCNKDNVLENTWYYQLRDILFKKKKIEFNKLKFYIIFSIKLLKNFAKTIFWCFFVKLTFYTRFKKVNKKYCFCSLHYNFFEKKK